MHADSFGRSVKGSQVKDANRGADSERVTRSSDLTPFQPAIEDDDVRIVKENEHSNKTRGSSNSYSRLLKSLWNRNANVFSDRPQHSISSDR
jgi:hypothetical protein